MAREEGDLAQKTNHQLSILARFGSNFKTSVQRIVEALPRRDLTVYPDSLKQPPQDMEYHFVHGDNSRISPKANEGHRKNPINVDLPDTIRKGKAKALVNTLESQNRIAKKGRASTSSSPYFPGRNTIDSVSRGRSNESRKDIDAPGPSRLTQPLPLPKYPLGAAVSRSRQPLRVARPHDGSYPMSGAPSSSPYDNQRRAPPYSSSDFKSPSRSPEKYDTQYFQARPSSDIYLQHSSRPHGHPNDLPDSLYHSSDTMSSPSKAGRSRQSVKVLSREAYLDTAGHDRLDSVPPASTPINIIDVDDDEFTPRQTRSSNRARASLDHSAGRTIRSETNSGQGGFGMGMKRKNDQTSRKAGRLSVDPVVSPVKLARKAKGSERDSTLVAASDDESEEVERLEISKDEIEEVEDPDGVYKGEDNDDIQVLPDSPAARATAARGSNNGPIRSSDTNGHGRRLGGRMRGKDGNEASKVLPVHDLKAKGKQSNNAPIPSSKTFHLVPVSYARILDEEFDVPVKTARLDPRGLSLFKEGNMEDYLLGYSAIKKIIIPRLDGLDPFSQPFVMITLSSDLRDEMLSWLNRSNGRHEASGTGRSSLLLVFKPNSREAHDFVRDLCYKLNMVYDLQADTMDNNSAAASLLDKNLSRVRKSTSRRGGADRETAMKMESVKIPFKGKARGSRDQDESDSAEPQVAQRSKGKTKTARASDQTKLDFSKASNGSGAVPSTTPTDDTTRRSKRLNGNNVVNMREPDEDEDDIKPAEVQRAVPQMPHSERLKVLFPYPPEGRADLTITKGDRFRVESGDFLNDTLLEFGLRYVLDQLGREDTRMKDKVHLFNSFFFDKLTNKKGKFLGEGQPWAGYESVKKWTKHQNIFEKEFVIVPINESLHWYLAVIFNPKGVLKEAQASVDESKQAVSPPLCPPELSEQEEPIEDKSNAGHDREDADLDDLGSNIGEVNEAIETVEHPKGQQSDLVNVIDVEEDEVLADTSEDPINMMDDAADIESRVDDKSVTNGVARLSIGPDGNPTVVGSSQANESGGGYINTPTLNMYNSQGRSPPLPMEKDVSEKPIPKALIERDIWKSDKCWIFTCDSLGGSHKAVANHLERWLHYEARDKGVITHDRPSPVNYVESKVPIQPNYSDCGLYLVHYVKQIIARSEQIIRFIQKPFPRAQAARDRYLEEVSQVWDAQATGHLRRDWTEIIDLLSGIYSSTRGNIPPKEDDPADNDTSQDFQEVMPVDDPPGEAIGETIHKASDVPAELEAPSNLLPELDREEVKEDSEVDANVSDDRVGGIMYDPHAEAIDLPDGADDMASEKIDEKLHDIDPHLDDISVRGDGGGQKDREDSLGLHWSPDEQPTEHDPTQSPPIMSTSVHSDNDVYENLDPGLLPDSINSAESDHQSILPCSDDDMEDEIKSSRSRTGSESTENWTVSTNGEFTEKPAGRRLPGSSLGERQVSARQIDLRHIEVDESAVSHGEDEVDDSPLNSLASAVGVPQTRSWSLPRPNEAIEDAPPSLPSGQMVRSSPSSEDDRGWDSLRGYRRTALRSFAKQESGAAVETLPMTEDTSVLLADMTRRYQSGPKNDVNDETSPVGKAGDIQSSSTLTHDPSSPQRRVINNVPDTTMGESQDYDTDIAIVKSPILSRVSAGERAMAGRSIPDSSRQERASRSISPFQPEADSPQKKVTNVYGKKGKRKSISTPKGAATRSGASSSVKSSGKRRKVDPNQSKLNFGSTSKTKAAAPASEMYGQTRDMAIDVDSGDDSEEGGVIQAV